MPEILGIDLSDSGSVGAVDTPVQYQDVGIQPLSDLKTAMDAEWANLHTIVDQALRHHKQRQEALLAQCGAHLQQRTNIDVTLPPVNTLPKEALNGSGSKLRPHIIGELTPRGARNLGRLRELSVNMSRMYPSSPTEAEAQWKDDDRSPMPLVAARATPLVPLGMLDMTLSPISSALERIEQLLVKQPHPSSSTSRKSQGLRRTGSADSLATEATNALLAQPQSFPRLHMPGDCKEVVAESVASSASTTSDLTFSKRDAKDPGMIEQFFKRRFRRAFKWYEDLEEPARSGSVSRIIGLKSFEATCGSVICLDCALTVYSMNYQMEHSDLPDNMIVTMLEKLCLLCYVVELLLKLCVHRLYFFVCGDPIWNWFDFGLVVSSVLDLIISTFLDAAMGDVSFMRAMRFLKLARILRGLRLMRFFAELRIMLNSLIGSVGSLFWSIVMLAMIIYLFSLLFVQGSVAHCSDVKSSVVVCDELRLYFGSVQLSMLSLFKASLGGDDWGVFYDAASKIGSFEAMVFLVFISFINIALMNVLTGIFVENAMQFAQPDRENLALEKRKQQVQDSAELRRIFQELKASSGQSGDDTISKTDFLNAMRQPRLRSLLHTLGLDIRDARIFFSMLVAANEGGSVDIDQFVDGCMRLKGPATSIDLQSVMLQSRAILKDMRTLRQDVSSQTAGVMHKLDSCLAEAAGDEPEEETSIIYASQECGPMSLAVENQSAGAFAASLKKGAVSAETSSGLGMTHACTARPSHANLRADSRGVESFGASRLAM